MGFWDNIQIEKREIIPRVEVGADLPPAVRVDDSFMVSPSIAQKKPIRTEVYAIDEHTTGKIQPGSPYGFPWVTLPNGSDLDKVWIGEAGHHVGMDSEARVWGIRLVGGTFDKKRQWYSGFPSKDKGPDTTEIVVNFVRDYVLPAVVLIVGTMVAGPTGILLTAALNAGLKISRGGRVSDVVIQSVRDNLPALVATGVFDKTIEQAKAYGLPQMYEYGKTLVIETERDAYAKAATLASAYVAQKNSLEELKKKYASSSAAIDAMAEYGASPLDIANGLGGETEKISMDNALIRNGNFESVASSNPLNDSSSSQSSASSAVVPIVGAGALFMLIRMFLK